MQPDKSPRGGKTQMVSIIVRCWPQIVNGSIVWRGEIQEAESGRKAAFPDLEHLLKILKELLDGKSSFAAKGGDQQGGTASEREVEVRDD